MLQAHIVGSGVSREHERDHDAEHQRNDGSRHSRTTHGGVDPVLEGRQHQDQHAQQSAGADAGQTALPVDTLPEAAQQHSHSHAGQEGAHDGGDVADNVVDEQGDEEGSAQGADQSDTAELGVIFFLDGLAGDAGVHVGEQDGNAGDGVGVTGGHGSGQAADHEHHADDRGQCVGSHVSKGVVAAGQGVTIHGGDGEAAHADDGGNKAPAEQQDALAQEGLASSLFVLGGVDTGTVGGGADNAHGCGQHQCYGSHDTVGAQAVEGHCAGLASSGEGIHHVLVAACQGDSTDSDGQEADEDSDELDSVGGNNGHVAADEHVDAEAQNGDDLTGNIRQLGDVSQVLGTAVQVVAQPDDLDDEHHKAHDLADDLFAAVVILCFLRHGQEALVLCLGEQQHGKDTCRCAQAVDGAAPTVVEAVADGTHGRTGADHGSTHGAEDQEEAEVAAAGQEAAALIFATAGDPAHKDHKADPCDKAADKQWDVFGIQHSFISSLESFSSARRRVRSGRYGCQTFPRCGPAPWGRCPTTTLLK